ncbi:uncharacterized protein HaLaN_20532, partial [Haematococcus lacustris]
MEPVEALGGARQGGRGAAGGWPCGSTNNCSAPYRANRCECQGKDLLGALTAFVPAPSVLAAPDGLLASLMGTEDGLDFEGVMHPGGTHKLDGPLPWELPDPLKHSDQFISICSNWQKHNPGFKATGWPHP